MCLSFTLLYFLLERVNLCYNFVSLIVVNDSVKNAGTGFGICSRIFLYLVYGLFYGCIIVYLVRAMIVCVM